MKRTKKRETTDKKPFGLQEGKSYYTIDEVAELFNVNTWTIRSWANRFKPLQPCQSKNGNILFTSADVERIGLINNLTKKRGITAKEVCELLERLE